VASSRSCAPKRQSSLALRNVGTGQDEPSPQPRRSGLLSTSLQNSLVVARANRPRDRIATAAFIGRGPGYHGAASLGTNTSLNVHGQQLG
jgi:hypothetical protein